MSGWTVVEGPLADFETSSYVFDFEDVTISIYMNLPRAYIQNGLVSANFECVQPTNHAELAFYDADNNCYDGYCYNESNSIDNIYYWVMTPKYTVRVSNSQSTKYLIDLQKSPFPEDSVPPNGMEDNYGGDSVSHLPQTSSQLDNNVM